MNNKQQSKQPGNEPQRALHEAPRKEGGYKFEVNDWGSFQYAGALAVYNLLLLRLEQFDNDVNKALEIFGVSVEPLPNGSPSFRESTLETIKGKMENFRDCEEIYKDLLALHLEFSNDESIDILDKCFQVARNCSYDLWATVATFGWLPVKIVQKIQVNLQMENGLPRINQVIQDENLLTGIKCALMVHYGYIQNTDEAFADFDT